MQYLKNISKIILFSLAAMYCHGMEPKEEEFKTSLENSSHKKEELRSQLKSYGVINVSSLGSLLDTFDNNPETPYFAAVNSGDVEAVKKFYKNTRYFFMQQYSYGYNALHIAAQKGYFSIAEFLVEKDKYFHLQIPAKDGFYPLHLAARTNNVSIVKLICEKNKKNVTQIDKCFSSNSLHMACTLGAKETADYLMKNYPQLSNVKCNLGILPHQAAQLAGYVELAQSIEAEHQKLFGNKKNGQVTIHNQSQKQGTKETTKSSKRKAQKQKNKKSPSQISEGETILVAKEAVLLHPMENALPSLTQESQIGTKMGLKNTNVEDIKGICENAPKTDGPKEKPEIVLLKAEQFANDNTSLTLFDSPNEKSKRKIRIENPLTKLSKKAEDWKARQTETREEKEARKRVRNQGKIIDFNGDGKSFEASTISQSMGDLKSHFSITDSESQSMKSFVSQSEGEMGDIAFEMKLSYPQLFNLLKKAGAQYISEVKFKSSNIIRVTLTILKEQGFIDGTIGKANIHVTRKNTAEAFVSHTTHGSSKYARWYHNPAIVVNFLEFISKSDPVIRAYLESIFAENCFSRDILRVTEDAKKPVDTNPDEAGED